MLIRASQQPEILAPEDDLVMRRLVQPEHDAGVSVTHVRLAGVHRPLRTDRSTRVYYVLEGSARFVVGNRPSLVAHAGDAVVIPRGVRYGFEGELAYLVINAPPYVEGDDDYG